MIRLKHKLYPIWINWDGEEDTFNKVKEFLLDDMAESGFDQFIAYSEMNGKPTADGTEKAWDERIKSTGKTPAPSKKKSKKPKGKTLGHSTTTTAGL